MEINEINAYLLSPAAQVALIIGLAELVKKAGVPAKFIPAVDLLLGLISGICVYGLVLGYGVTDGVMFGTAMGLSACGLFSGVKNIIEGDNGNGERESEKES